MRAGRGCMQRSAVVGLPHYHGEAGWGRALKGTTVTDSPSLEELWSWSDEGGRLTEKERVYCTRLTPDLLYLLFSLAYFLSTSFCLLFAFTFSSLPRCLTHLFTETHTPIWQKHSLSLSTPSIFFSVPFGVKASRHTMTGALAGLQC